MQRSTSERFVQTLLELWQAQCCDHTMHIYKVCHNFCFSLLGPARPCSASVTHVLQLPALSPEHGGQDSLGKVLLPNTGKSKEQEVDYMHALLLAASCTLLFPPKRQWSNYVDKGARVWKLMSEGILLGWEILRLWD